MNGTTETITLGGGCFWCVEAVYEKVRGVTAVESGYCNGETPNPSYEQVCSGRTGHGGDDIAEEAERLVTQFFQTAPDAVRTTKELIRRVTHAEIDQNLIDYTANMIAEIRQTDEGREGTSAFLGKRKPWWQNG